MVRFYILMLMLSLACASHAATSVATSAYYISGDYGNEDDTTMWYAPITVAYRYAGLKLSATASYLSIDGPPGGTAGVIDGNGALPASGKAEGAGDILLKAGYDISTISRRLQLRPQLKIKLPSADEDKGLGTGATDYTMQLDAFYFIEGWWPYVSIGYRWRGDGRYSADDGSDVQRFPLELENGEIFGAGFFKPLTQATSLTLYYEHRSSSIAHLAATEEALATVQYRVDLHWLTSFSVGTGFSSRSADTIFGVQLEYRY